MRYISSVLAIIIGLVFTGISIASDPSAIYKSKCALCHGAKGGGVKGVAPPLKGNKFIIESKPVEVKKVILEGRIGKAKEYKEYSTDMPKTVMPDADAEALVKYLKNDLQK